MENNQFQLSFTTELNKGLTLTPLRQAFIQDDNQAHVFTIHTTRNGAANALTGSTIKGFFIPYGLDVTVELSGEVNAAGAAVVSLTQDCYAFVGRFNLVIQAINSASTASIFYGEGYVTKTRTDKVIEPSGASPSLGTLEERINNLTYSDVGAAPAGYGLGTDAAIRVDDLSANGYIATPNTPSGAWAWGQQIHLNYLSATQILCDTNGYIMVRTLANGVWQPWEWINPPMTLNVEYRTTERWNDKAVYTKLVDLGEFANAGYVDTGIDGYPLRYSANKSNGSALPYINSSMDNGYTSYLAVNRENYNIRVYMYGGSNVTGKFFVQLWYYKN